MMLTLVLFFAQAVPVPPAALVTAEPPVMLARANESLPMAPSAAMEPVPLPVTAAASEAFEPFVVATRVTPLPAAKTTRLAPASSKRVWMALSIAQHSAAGFDAWTTRHRMKTGGYHETNPFLKPFAGNDSLYAVMQVAPTVLDYVGNRMRNSQHTWMRRLWWLPQVAQTTTSLSSGALNLTR
jgi:hypothetical protein